MFEIVFVLWRGTRGPIEAHVHIRQELNRHIPSMDSDLEAFSHNPTVGRFAPLPFQASA